VTLIKSISGIRGTIGGLPGENLTPFDIVKFTAAFGHWVVNTTGNKKIIIGRDARPSGEMITGIVKSTLMALGLDVVDLDLTTTPTVQIAVCDEKAGGGIIVTASHNPVQWNALKLLGKSGQFLTASEAETVFKIADEGKEEFAANAKLGHYKRNDEYLKKHIAKILSLPLVDAEAIRARDFKIAIDCVNSTGGIVVPMLLKALGVEKVTEFYCEVNGQFPHNPEPLPENITHICSEIKNGSFDLGIVVDPDVDRLVLVSEDGNPFGEEYTLVAVADYVLSQKTGTTVSNLSSSRALKDITLKKKGKYFVSPVGEANVVSVMKEKKAVIGGEGSGGVIYPALHYGRDALVGIALFLSHLARTGKSASYLRSTYPNYHITKLKIELTPGIDIENILEQIKDKYKKFEINIDDGVRIDFDSEWVHLRKSNTEPVIRIIAESDMESKSQSLAQKIISDIREMIADKDKK
jgi:phosphomannomutase